MITPILREMTARHVGMPARTRRLLGSPLVRSGIGYALLLSGLFRLSAFVREIYIAARFGLTRATDTYFSLQQLPLTVSTFMFGAFALAFVPAYARGRRGAGELEWLPGLVFHGTLAGLVLTALNVGLAPTLLDKYVGSADPASVATLNMLSTCYVPIIYLGIWTSMLNATGHALRCMTAAALPYLIMAASVIVICEATSADLLSLPISMTMGFWLMGAVAAYNIYRPLHVSGGMRSVLWPFRFPEFRTFGKQMLASTAENAGFAGNQLLMIYFFGLMGTGVVTANNYAMRIGLLANSLITMPVAQLAQSRFCTVPAGELRRVFSTYLAWTLAAGICAAVAIYILRGHIVAILYLRGKFTGSDVDTVTSLIPAWLAYLLILSVNCVTSRFLFVVRKGNSYATFMLAGYLLANVLRAVCLAHYRYAPAVVWCAVAGEGAGMLLSLRTCYRKAPDSMVSPAAVTAS